MDFLIDDGTERGNESYLKSQRKHEKKNGRRGTEIRRGGGEEVQNDFLEGIITAIKMKKKV